MSLDVGVESNYEISDVIRRINNDNECWYVKIIESNLNRKLKNIILKYGFGCYVFKELIRITLAFKQEEIGNMLEVKGYLDGIKYIEIVDYIWKYLYKISVDEDIDIEEGETMINNYEVRIRKWRGVFTKSRIMYKRKCQKYLIWSKIKIAKDLRRWNYGNRVIDLKNLINEK